MKQALKIGVVVLGLLFVLACTGGTEQQKTAASGPPPAPKGRPDLDQFKAAMQSGEIKNIEGPFTIPDDLKMNRDLEYANINGQSLKLDLCEARNLDKPAPAILFIHGGGWSGGRKEEYLGYVLDFAKRGYVAASMTYRFTQVAKYPAQVQDCKCAVRWLRAHADEYHIDKNRIAVMGGSAGGYLALMVGYTDDPALEGDGGNADQSSRVQAVIDGYGPTDFTGPLVRQAPQVTGLMGMKYEQAPDLFRQASPIFYVKSTTPPTVIIHGTIDKTVPISESIALDAKLKEAGVPHVFDRIEGYPHTADSFEGVFEHCSAVIDQFLKENMK
jgi:acetyl esterase/lipase